MLTMLKKLTLMYRAKYYGFIIWSPEYKGMHFTMCYRDALEWAGCYDDAIIVRGKWLRQVSKYRLTVSQN